MRIAFSALSSQVHTAFACRNDYLLPVIVLPLFVSFVMRFDDAAWSSHAFHSSGTYVGCRLGVDDPSPPTLDFGHNRYAKLVVP